MGAAETFVEADIWTVAQTDQGNVVLVRPKGSDLAVPIFIGQLETQAILIGLGGVEVPRPLTHDLLLSLIASLGAEMDRIEINGLKEGTFFARLVLLREGASFLIDARPSDAIGLAVRCKCPVFIAESVVDEAGISVNLVTEGGTVQTGSGGGDSGLLDGNPERAVARSRLQDELEKAIEAEDYEKAAQIRDKLKELGE
ncbi:MAG TPA: bifunctional nuclease family protein [Rectinemataceae bacterium]|nr:bifunctional nuclease family protein [Rectinemataceae bacterium]